jgi:hypothetical protein
MIQRAVAARGKKPRHAAETLYNFDGDAAGSRTQLPAPSACACLQLLYTFDFFVEMIVLISLCVFLFTFILFATVAVGRVLKVSWVFMPFFR